MLTSQDAIQIENTLGDLRPGVARAGRNLRVAAVVGADFPLGVKR